VEVKSRMQQLLDRDEVRGLYTQGEQSVITSTRETEPRQTFRPRARCCIAGRGESHHRSSGRLYAACLLGCWRHS
jgi:hypothetical protein